MQLAGPILVTRILKGPHRHPIGILEYPMRRQFSTAGAEATCPRDHHLRRTLMKAVMLTPPHPTMDVG